MNVFWAFDISTYHWSTQAKSYDGNSYVAKIIPDSFDGVTMRWNMGTDGLIAPNDFTFEVENADGALARGDLEGEDVLLTLVIDGSESRKWKFRIQRAVPAYGVLKCYCVDFLQEYLQGDWPKTINPKEQWPSDDGDESEDTDTYCVPFIFGTAYVPVRSVNTGTDRYYVIGADTSPTYTVDEVASPRDWPSRSTWASGSYSFNQSNDSGYKLLQAIIADSDGDSVVDANGLWLSGSRFLDMLVKYSRSDTSTHTGPEEWVEDILEDMGVASADIDTGAGSSFETAGTTYASRGIEFNGGYWKKESRETVISNLLAQCDSFLSISDKVELYTFSKTSIETLTKSKIKKLSFRSSPFTQVQSDGGRVASWDNADNPQDVLLTKGVVGLHESQSSITDPSSEVFEYRFQADSQNAQKAALLYFAKKFLKKDTISFETSGTVLSTLASIIPGKVITLNDTIFGASFSIVITSLAIKSDLTIAITGARLEYLEDWGDLTFSSISVTADGSSGWQMVVTDATGNPDIDVNWSAVQDDDGNKPEDNATDNSGWEHPDDNTKLNALVSRGNWETKSTNFTAVAFHQYRIQTATKGSDLTMTLPASPSADDWIQWADDENNFGTDNFLILRNGNTIENQTYDVRCDRNGDHGQLEYTGSTWIFTSGA